MRVVVTGGAGYLGIPLCEKLLLRNHTVLVIDEFMHNTVEDVQAHFDAFVKENDVKGEITFSQADIRNLRSQHEVIRGADAVIHLASLVGDPQCGRFPEDTYQINAQATKMLIETCEYHGVKRFLFASTCSIYGSREGVSDETTPDNPISLYAKSKLEGEELLKESGLSWTSLRNATIYGLSPRMRFDLVVNIMSVRAAAGQSIKVFGGDQWRPNVHVYDCAEAFALVLDSARAVTHRQIYNIVNENCTIKEIAEKIASAVPTKVEIDAADVDRRDYKASNKRLVGLLKWSPEFTIEKAALEIKAYYDEQKVDYAERKFHNYKKDADQEYEEILRRGEYDKE